VRRDEGSTLPLTILFGMLALLIVLIAVAATSLYLERKRLFTLADGAALVGAEAFELDEVLATSSGYRPVLQNTDVSSAVSAYLESTPTVDLEGLHLERAETVDGRSATVELSAYWRPPVLTLLVPEGLRIEVTAVARSVFS
jgi:uncharacterized membrane protein